MLLQQGISLRGVSYTTPDHHPLFDQLELSFGAGRTGLIGRNGTGKTTLLKLITGEYQPTSGVITREGRIGVLRQRLQIDPSETIGSVFGVRDALEQLARVTSGHGTDEDVTAVDWTLELRINAALAAVDLPEIEPGRPLATLSGGQRTRVALAALLFGEPDMILLDEPTNNLDRPGRAAVARVLSRWQGGAIVVSHDRELLRKMDRIVELSTLGARVYGGNWDLYQERQSAERAAAAEHLDQAERQIKAVDRKLQQEREKQAHRASQGKRDRATSGIPKMQLNAMRNRSEKSTSRAVQLADRLREDAAREASEARQQVERLKQVSVELSPSNLPAGRTVLLFDRVSGGPPGAPDILHELSFEMTGPERIAVTGPNGSGKTTLLHLATGELTPSRGTIRRTERLILLDQQAHLLRPEETIVANFRRLNPEDEVSACRAALARFLFSADAALRPVHDLSGGEVLRAGLACVLGCHHPPELLLLDEPTNHLDLDSIAAIEAGLRAYDGALLVVSHDEEFLRAINIERRIELPMK